MPAHLKNEYWKKRLTSGRKKKFSTADRLRAACEDYFQWVDDHPWIQKAVITRGKNAGETIAIPHPRPYTLSGLCLHLKVGRNYWKQLRRKTVDEDLSSVIAWVEGVIYENLFTGAVVGAFSGRMVSRYLGLSDQVSTTIEQASKAPFQVTLKLS